MRDLKPVVIPRNPGGGRDIEVNSLSLDLMLLLMGIGVVAIVMWTGHMIGMRIWPCE